MIRPIIVLALLLSAAIMMRGLAGDWRKNLTIPATDATKKAAPTGGAAAGSPPPQAKALQPTVPGVLPDLKVGYLFNPERMLAGAEVTPPSSDNTAEGASENTLGITASMSEVNYTGSIITDEFSRAIIAYPAAKTAAGPQQPMASRSSKARPQPAAPAAGSEEHAKLAVGDVLDGYEVTDILPDKLIFTKGGETVEKLLYDPDKKRQAAPPRPASGPMPGGGPAKSPQQVTIGGNEASPTPTVPPPAGSPTAPSHAGGLSSPQTAPTPASLPAKPGATGTSQSSPLRRMVISRQPAPGPDTSRVIRQSLGGEGMIPLPPGAGPQ